MSGLGTCVTHRSQACATLRRVLVELTATEQRYRAVLEVEAGVPVPAASRASSWAIIVSADVGRQLIGGSPRGDLSGTVCQSGCPGPG